MEKFDKYVDQQYHFKGKWDVPSLCGLKIVRKPEKTIIIATNLYKLNPGTSISRWTAPLANSICNDFNIDPIVMNVLQKHCTIGSWHTHICNH